MFQDQRGTRVPRQLRDMRERSFRVMKVFWNQIGTRWRNVMNIVNATSSKLCHVYLSKIKKKINKLSPGFSSGQSPKGGRMGFTPHFTEQRPEVHHGEGKCSGTHGISGRGGTGLHMSNFSPY